MTSLDELLDTYDYDLPDEQIARFPHPQRDGGRLLCVHDHGLIDQMVTQLPTLLEEGDLLVVNDTAVIPARLYARRSTGGRVEVFYLGDKTPTGLDVVMLRPSRRLKPGEALQILDSDNQDATGLTIRLVSALASGQWLIDSMPSATHIMSVAGEAPIPPYFKRRANDEDTHRYQTVFAQIPGAVAAPTAGLHLSSSILAALEKRGVGICRVTLHVGAGTFLPLQVEHVQRGELHSERYVFSEEAADSIRKAKIHGKRVIAVGTTVARTLESAWLESNAICAKTGDTRLFIRDNFDFRVIDGLLTNFHLPRSSLLMLVSAFAGYKKTMAAYRHAIEKGYRFFSYGDAMLILRDMP